MTELTKTTKTLEEMLSKFVSISAEFAATGNEDSAKLVESAKFVEDSRGLLEGKLAETIDKFMKRTKEIDEVSGELKYGEKYRARVHKVNELFEEAMAKSLELLEAISGPAAAAEAAKKEAERKKQAQLKQEEEERLERERQEEERLKQIAKEEEARAAVDKQKRLDDAVKNVILAQQSEEDMIYGKDLARVKKFGKGSLNDAIDILLGFGSSGDSARQKTDRALRELHRMFERIVAHPESEPCRTINAMNEKFRQDIASVEGGVEILIAAGFQLRFFTTEDDQAVETKHVEYFLEEPDLATNMDAWTTWFDELKQTLDMLSEKL